MNEGDHYTVDIPSVNVGTNGFEIRNGQGCYGNICSGNAVNLNGFGASRNPNGSWTIHSVPSAAAALRETDVSRRSVNAELRGLGACIIDLMYDLRKARGEHNLDRRAGPHRPQRAHSGRFRRPGAGRLLHPGAGPVGAGMHHPHLKKGFGERGEWATP